MKTIDCWAAMQPYGIVPLTTEPDGLKYRIVCDVTERGRLLVEKALGISGIQLEKNWDYGTNDQPHVGSAMLSPELLMLLGIYALLDDGCCEVWATRSFGLVGIQEGDPPWTMDTLHGQYGNDIVQKFSSPRATCNWNLNLTSYTRQ